MKDMALSAEPRYHRPWYPPFENREGWGSLSRGSANHKDQMVPSFPNFRPAFDTSVTHRFL